MDKPSLLVVDDDVISISILASILDGYYHIKIAKNAHDAIDICLEEDIKVILLDIIMPFMDGYELCEQLKLHPSTRPIPVIFITSKNHEFDEVKAFNLGAADYITKPIKPEVIKKRVENQLYLSEQSAHLQNQVKELTKEIEDSKSAVLTILGKAAEYRDKETGHHVFRVSEFAKVVARSLGLAEAHVSLLSEAAILHDLGKIGIPDSILLKRGKLTNNELNVMRKHVEFGLDILNSSHFNKAPLLEMAKIIVATHHEKWDGTGYPLGLSEDEIPVEGQIVSVCDVFDALTCARPYKKPWTNKDALDFILMNRAVAFSPKVVDSFIKCYEEIVLVQDKLKD